MRKKHKKVFVHETAIIEKDVKIGAGTLIWDNVHIRAGAKIGKNCIVGEKSYIAYGVEIGNLVKINSYVYICARVKIEDMVMIAAGAVFTNDKFPRAAKADLIGLQVSQPRENTPETYVKKGATIGANVTLGAGLEIGEFAMVGMGSVVTKNVLAHQLVYGNPAQLKGYVCKCGNPLTGKDFRKIKKSTKLLCKNCCKEYVKMDEAIHEI